MSEEYYKNRCIKLDKKLDRVIDSHTKLEDKMKDLQQRIDKAIETIESYNLGKYDYSIPPGGIIELLEILKSNNKQLQKEE